MQPVSIPTDVEERAAEFSGRAWVLDRVYDWLDGGGPSSFLITGEPGSGKTALAAWLAGAGPPPGADEAGRKLARVRDAWRAAHFCMAEDQRGSVDPTRFAQSLARQLSDRYDEYATAVIDRIAPGVNIHQEARANWGTMVGAQIERFIVTARPEDIFNRAVRDPLEEVVRRRTGERVLILVDALDEALTFVGTTIIDLLAGAKDMQGVRFLLTSRNEPRVLRAFRRSGRLDLSAPEHAQRADVDVRAYVERRLAEGPLRGSASAGGGPAVSASQLVAAAAGNFLYVKFVLDEAVFDRLPLAELAHLPLGLYGLYRDYLDRLIPEMRQLGSSQVWLDRYQPLLGCLSVAIPAVPLDLLPSWLSQDEDKVVAWLGDVAQLTEPYAAADGDGYRLYHRSMADFLAATRYREGGADMLNLYHTPPRSQHERIIAYYASRLQGAWQTADAYGLRRLASHLQVRLALEPQPQERDRRARELYALVLDERFRAAQRERLGDSQASLDDLRTTLAIALARDDMVQALACIGAHRRTVRRESMADAVFEAADRGDFAPALQRAKQYDIQPTWAQALHLYLACEAALAGDADAAGRAVAACESLPSPGYAWELCGALLARAARTMAHTAPGGGDAAAWLARWNRAGDAGWLLTRDDGLGSGAAALADAEAELDRVLGDLEEQLAQGAGEEALHGLGAPSVEVASAQADFLKDRLVALAATAAGRRGIDRALALFLSNPYPRYRDIGLVAAAVAITAVPDASEMRERLRQVIRCGLDHEGVGFTFDLPCVLLAEARRRDLAAPALLAYLNEATAWGDRPNEVWGTAARLRSAQAAALFRRGDGQASGRPANHDEALRWLGEAAARLGGFSGYATVHALALASRWHEFGRPDGATVEELCARAEQHAASVLDYQFQQERLELVAAYRRWSDLGTPAPAAALAELAGIADHDTRTVFIDYLSARWAASEEGGYWDGLKALVPPSLADGTRLDAVLGRLVGLRLDALKDDDLEAAIRICAEDLTTGRPWGAAAPILGWS